MSSRPARPLPSRNWWICSMSAWRRATASAIGASSSGRSAEPLDTGDPVRHAGRHLGPGWGLHAARERPDVVPPPVTGAFAGRRGGVRRGLPGGSDHEHVDVADLAEGEERTGRPATRSEGLPVDPPGGRGVPLNLEVLPQFLVADGAALPEMSRWCQGNRDATILQRWSRDHTRRCQPTGAHMLDRRSRYPMPRSDPGALSATIGHGHPVPGIRGIRTGGPPLVGREREQATLRAHLAAALGRRGGWSSSAGRRASARRRWPRPWPETPPAAARSP